MLKSSASMKIVIISIVSFLIGVAICIPPSFFIIKDKEKVDYIRGLTKGRIELTKFLRKNDIIKPIVRYDRETYSSYPLYSFKDIVIYVVPTSSGNELHWNQQ
ncbi:MAG: hypothetical protein KAI43_06200 [Candidatus Aureabacteria bacterium]|nr:hypothetical protein [Candidatus Auribacterota bacterium]